MIPAALQAALAVYDEAALVVLSNKGLYRRAQRDVEEGKVTLGGVTQGKAQVLADGDTVEMDARGPAKAACTCPAPGMCRHRLAAVLLLQAASPGADDDRPVAATSLAAADEVKALDSEILRKWAGKAAWRAALELAGSATIVSDEGAALVVGFCDDGPEIRMEVRILAGQGLDGMVSRAPAAQRKAWHAAAMVAARAHFGILEASPEPIAAMEVGEPGTYVVDSPFLEEVMGALTECARTAFNLAPISLEERLFTLSVSSRAEAMPRPAALLRALAAQVRSRRRRDFTFEADRCLELCADLYALTLGLSQPRDDEVSAQLRGVARQAYAASEDLRLTGCGAQVWASPSGARGVTGYFYDPARDRWLTLALARAAGQDAWFEPVQAFRSEHLWGGPVLANLTRARIVVNHAAVSAEGRLSTGQDVRASIVGAIPAAALEDWPCCFNDWTAARQRLVARVSSGAPLAEPILLRPRRVARPVFNDLTQTLDWPVEDLSGQWLALSLAHGRDRSDMITALESRATAGWTGFVVALATVGSGRFVLRPFALIEGENLYSLGLDALPPSPKIDLVRDIRAMMAGVPRACLGAARSSTGTVIDRAWQALVEQVELGIGHVISGTRGDLGVQGQRLSDVGLVKLGGLLVALESAAPEDRARAFFTAAFALRLARQEMLELPLLV